MPPAIRHRLLLGLALAGLVGIFFVPPIPQDPAYHRFADDRTWLAIPHALNVLTNLLFAWIGIEGLYRLLRQNSLRIVDAILPAYLTFFSGLILVAFGSAYYHWSPDNTTLVWDRLPIALLLMSFFCILCGERISADFARKALPWLLLAGLASVVYWHFSEQAGRGDLRAYALVVFVPVMLAPLILWLCPSRFDRSPDLWWFLAFYLASKLCEWFDAEIYDLLGFISGHSLKHIAAASGCLVFLRHLRLRQPRVG